MLGKHSEIRFEEAIEQSLLQAGGFSQRCRQRFDASRCLFADEVVAFVQATQPKPWHALVDFLGDKAGGDTARCD